MRIKNPVFCGFQAESNQKNFLYLERAHCISEISAIAFTALSIDAFAAGIFFSATVLLGIACCATTLAVTSVGICCLTSIKLRSYVLHDPKFPKPEEVSPYIFRTQKGSPVKGFPLVHSADTALWRKRLIQAAEHNVILSGNYCGEKAFDEILDIFLEKLEMNPEFKIVILSSPIFVRDSKKLNYSNKSKIYALKKRFPDRFQIVYNSYLWQANCSFKYTQNHTKALCVDFGRYFILGGSAVKDNFSKEGVNKPRRLNTSEYPYMEKSFEEKLLHLELILKCRLKKRYDAQLQNLLNYLQTISLKEICNKKKIQEVFENLYFETLQLSANAEKEKSKLMQVLFNFMNTLYSMHSKANRGLFSPSFMPGQFRDMDFAFHDCGGEHSQGRMLYLQLLSLAHRLEHLENMKNKSPKFVPYRHQAVYCAPAFTGNASRCMKALSVISQMLNQKIPHPRDIRTHLKEFKRRCDKQKGRINMLASGPESDSNDLKTTMLQQIQNAKNEIFINHMYFNPPKDVIEALQAAVRRGVRLKIITTDVYKGCPKSHNLFGPNNLKVLDEFLAPFSEEEKKRVSILVYRERKMGLHKKVIIFDRKYILAGSSNFGFKSLVTAADYEINFLLKSVTIAKKTIAVFKEDELLSVKLSHPFKISTNKILLSYFYRQLSFIWG